ncbi:MAG: hypothetical protein ACWGN2_04325 [Anaerolineales bacterium]
MNTISEEQVFRPELASRRGELIAWSSAVLVNGTWIVLLLLGQSLSFWLLILGIPLLLISFGISLANWMDRHTLLKLNPQGITYSNGLRNVKLGWLEIQEVRVLPAQWGRKVQVFGEQAYFGFQTLGEVEANGKLLGRTGFIEGEQVLEKILEEAALRETKQVNIGNHQEGYYYSRE